MFPKGEDLQRTGSVDDYKVKIGLGLCEKLKVNTNSLQCNLPEHEPEPLEDNNQKGTLRVTVSFIGEIDGRKTSITPQS